MFTAVILIQVAALIMLFIELTYIALKPPSKLQAILLLLVTSTFLMMFGYLLEILAQSLEAAMFGTYISYVGKPMTMLFAFLFIIEYVQFKIPDIAKVALVIYHEIFVVVVLLNDYLHLFYPTVGFDRSKTFSPLVLSHGFLYYLYMATVLVYLVIDLYISIREFRHAKTKEYKDQIYLIIGTPLSGMLGLIVFLTGITKGYDTTMLGCFIGTLMLGVLFLKYRIFDMVNFAKDQALKNTNNGLIVVDARGKTAYQNTVAAELMKNGITVESLIADSCADTPAKYNDKYYNIVVSKLVRNGHYYGTSIEINDITDSYIYSFRLENDVLERTKQIKNMQRSVIGSFAQIVEARDDTTGLHIQNTSKFVRAIASELKKSKKYSEIIDENFIDQISSAAPMHDIGKISIPDNILLKPGKLTPEEFDIMKTHTTAGAEVIEKTMSGVETESFIKTATEMALCHHEHWDGNGYPGKLKGEEIPLPARIMAVADVFDALRSERPYKVAFSTEESLRIIKSCSGTQFDPDVVDAFVASDCSN